MTLSTAEKRHAAQLMAQLERHKETNPLAHADLWDNPQPQTSQRRCVESLGQDVTVRAGSGAGKSAPPAESGRPDVVVVLGGNGSGKSEVLMQTATAMALGRHHKDAIRWAKRNGFPLDRLPDGQGRVIVSSLTHVDSRKILRPKADRYSPPGSKWRNRWADNEAELRMPESNGVTGVIVFKAARQGREAFQGDWAHMYGYDEEHPEDIFKETQSRHTRPDCGGVGFHMLSMTPLKGVTWVARKFLPEHALTEDDGPGELRVSVHWLHTEDSPHATDDNLRALRSYGSHERDARSKGMIVALEGRVFEEFERHTHVVPSFLPPPHWKRMQWIDWGTANPAALLHAALDPKDHTWHVYHERYLAQHTPKQHAEATIDKESIEEARLRREFPQATIPSPLVEYRVADPEDLGARQTWALHHGLATIPADKSVREGINDVKDALRLDAMGRPHLVVHNCCPHTISEFGQYVWDVKNSASRDDPDAPRKKNDHAMDAVRYGIRMAKRLGL